MSQAASAASTTFAPVFTTGGGVPTPPIQPGTPAPGAINAGVVVLGAVAVGALFLILNRSK